MGRCPTPPPARETAWRIEFTTPTDCEFPRVADWVATLDFAPYPTPPVATFSRCDLHVTARPGCRREGDDEMPVAVVSLSAHRGPMDDAAYTEIYVHSVWVRPDSRGVGVATELVTAALDEARRRFRGPGGSPISRVRLHTSDDSDNPARRLYEKLGFTVRRRIPRYYAPRSSEVEAGRPCDALELQLLPNSTSSLR